MTDQRATQRKERLMDVSAAFVADAQSPKLVQPTQGAFHHPASFTQATAMRPTRARQLVGNPQALQPAVMRTTPIRPISLYGCGTLSRSTWLAGEGGHGQYQGLQLPAVMHVGSGQLNAQRHALGVGEKMMFAASFAAVRRVWPRLKPPKTARAELESTTARDQSIRSATCKRRAV